MEQLSVQSVLEATATVINNPTKNVRELLGIKDLDMIDVGFLYASPTLFWGRKAYQWISNKITKSQEKERMYREIIRKQQAAIQKQHEINKELEMRQRQADANSEYQRQQIQSLKGQVANLEDVISVLNDLKEKEA